MLGSQELIIIFVIAVLLFGANKLPEPIRSLGSSMGEFQNAQRETELNLRQLEKPVKETIVTKSKIQKATGRLGIDIRDKSDDQLLDEIQKIAAKPEEAA
jgi:sec-independent protein translocase protein TatA